jgi:hypothetical protein
LSPAVAVKAGEPARDAEPGTFRLATAVMVETAARAAAPAMGVGAAAGAIATRVRAPGYPARDAS